MPFNLFAKHYNNLENLKKLSKHFAVLESTPKSHIDFYNQAAACVEINKLEDDGFWSRKFMKILYLRCDSTEFTASDRSLIRNMLNEHWTRFSWNFQEDLCRIM